MSFLQQQKGVVAASLIFAACLLVFSIVSRQNSLLYGNKKSYDLWTPSAMTTRRLQANNYELTSVNNDLQDIYDVIKLVTNSSRSSRKDFHRIHQQLIRQFNRITKQSNQESSESYRTATITPSTTITSSTHSADNPQTTPSEISTNDSLTDSTTSIESINKVRSSASNGSKHISEVENSVGGNLKPTTFTSLRLSHSTEQEIEVDESGSETSKSTIEGKVRLIYGHVDGGTRYSYWRDWSDVIDLTQCDYTNCQLTTESEDIQNADIVIFTVKQMGGALKMFESFSQNRWKQYWVLTSKESSAYGSNHFKPDWDAYFNITATYRTGSTVVTHDFKPVLTKRQKTLQTRDYSVGKTHDMVAYVSNCGSVGYDRLPLMKAVANGSSIGYNFTFELYGGCGVKPPCEREHPAYHRGFNSHLSTENNCTRFNSQYRFFFSFENSLCTDYITEKFWSVLKSEDFMIPVVMGGMSIKEYLYIAPPNSFIHVENFTSIMQLQKHLVSLIEDPAAFNRYHTWREDIELVHNDLPNACDLCRIANERPNLPADKDWARWWNKPQNCRSVDDII